MTRLGTWWRGLWAPVPPAGNAPQGEAAGVRPGMSTIPEPPADILGAATLPHVVIPLSPSAAPAALVRSGVPMEALLLSKVFEGLSLVPYDDNGSASGGTWSIGYGSTRDLQGRPVTASTPRITQLQAVTLAVRDLDRAAQLVAKDFPGGLPPRWWAVAVLMCNNLGRMSVWGATLLVLLQSGAWSRAADQMRHYRNQRSATGALVPVLGLRRRRWAEAAYALGMDAEEAKRRAWAEIRTPEDWPPLPA